MALKRKRSSSSISPVTIPPSFSSPALPVVYTSLSPSPSPSPFPPSQNHDIPMSNYHPSNCPSLHDDSRPHLHSRTRKRVRNKPDESSIHGTHTHNHYSLKTNPQVRKNLPDSVRCCPFSTSTATSAFDPSPVRSKPLANFSSPTVSSCLLEPPYTALIGFAYSLATVNFIHQARMPRVRRPSPQFL